MHEIVVNLHMHTRYSDGSGTHKDIAHAAIKAGLDAVIVTDHNVLVHGLEGYYRVGRDRVLLLVGQEVHDQDRDPQKNHLLVFNANRDLSYLADDPQTLINRVNEAGGLSFIAHPKDPEAPAQQVDPAASVVYIDNDPIVLAHGRALLADNATTTVITADMRDTDTVMAHPDVVKLIDFDRPVAALFVSVLHCVPDSDDPGALVRRVMDRLAPGSFVVISHLVTEDTVVRERLTDFMLTATQGNWGRVRSAADVTPFFDGLELLDPGLVEISTWRPDGTEGPVQETTEWIEFGGVARKL